MPTIGTRPSLETTQAIGALLLHQFAQERFTQAGAPEDLIRVAETEERLDNLPASLLREEEQNTTCEEDCFNQDAISLDNLSTMTNRTSEVSQSTIIDTTIVSNGNNENSDAGDRFMSMVNSTMTNDNTVYHSMNHSNNQNGNGTGAREPSSFDRAKSLKIMESYGRELRKIAEEFEKTRLRKDIKDKADKISLCDLNKDTFHKLLEELFQDGVSRVKIVTLFFFCTDIALRAVKFANDLVVKLMGWSFSYIIDTVCRIVHELGGWESVLFNQIPMVLVSCCAALGAIALAIYINKSLRAS